MIEKNIDSKEVLITKKYTFYFKEPLKLEASFDNKEVFIIENKNLEILTDNITKFAEVFEEVYEELINKNNFTEDELIKKRYLDNIIDTVERNKNRKEKKKINSRKKGQRGERLFIDALAKHFPGLKIMRTPGSGAFSTTHSLKGQDNILCGDLFAENNNSEEYKRFMKYTWEAKNYGTLPDFLGAITYKKSEPLISWIQQAERDAIKNEKDFVILLRSDRSPNFALIKEDFYKYRKDTHEKYDYLIRFKYNNEYYLVKCLENMLF